MRLCRMRLKRLVKLVVLVIVLTVCYVYYTQFLNTDHGDRDRHSLLAQVQERLKFKPHTQEKHDEHRHEEGKEDSQGIKLFAHGIQKLWNREKEPGEEERGRAPAENHDRAEDDLANRLAKQQEVIRKQSELLEQLQKQAREPAQLRAPLTARPPHQQDDHRAQPLAPAPKREDSARESWRGGRVDMGAGLHADSGGGRDSKVMKLEANGVQPRQDLREKKPNVQQRAPVDSAAGGGALQMFERAQESGRELSDKLRPPRFDAPGSVGKFGGQRNQAADSQRLFHDRQAGFQGAEGMFHDSVRNQHQARPVGDVDRSRLLQESMRKNLQARPQVDFRARPQVDFRARPQVDFRARPQVDFRARPQVNFRARPQGGGGGAAGAEQLFQDSMRNNAQQGVPPAFDDDRFRHQDQNPFLHFQDRPGGQRPVDHRAFGRNIAGIQTRSSGAVSHGQHKGAGESPQQGQQPPAARGNSGVAFEDEEEYNQEQNDRAEYRENNKDLDEGNNENGGQEDGSNYAHDSKLLAERFKHVQNAFDNPHSALGAKRPQGSLNYQEIRQAFGGQHPFYPEVKNLSGPVEDKVKCVPLRTSFIARQVCVYPPHVDTKTSKELTNTGTFHEESELKEFDAALDTNSSLAAIDIGAGLGLYSLVAASRDRPVLAVEPMKDHQGMFAKTMQINSLTKQITLVVDALGERIGLGKIRSPHPSGNMGTVYVDPVQDLTKLSMGDSSLVRILRLDDLIPVLAFHSAVMKLDAQGDEELVLRGAEKFFQKVDVQYVLMHWLPTMNREHLKECFQFLSSRHYLPTPSVHGDRVYSELDLEKDINFVVWRKMKEASAP